MFNHLYPEELASKIKPIKKLYYKASPYSGFPYKIAFVCDSYGRVGNFRDRYFKNDLKQEPDYQTFITKLDDWLRKVYKQKYEYPANLKDRDGEHRTLFLQSHQHFNTILKLFGDYVVSAERPIDQEHYEITPYAFRPRLAKKHISNNQVDLGQGILDTIYDVYKTLLKSDKKIKKVSKK